MAEKIAMDVERLVAWALQEELSKRRCSSAEGIWDQIKEYGQRGGIDPGHGAAQRYPHFGLPDPDAERIEKAIAEIGDTAIDWRRDLDAIAGDMAGLITINDLVPRPPTRQPRAGWGQAGDKALKAWWGPKGAVPLPEKPRDVIMVGSIKTAALITMHAIRGSRPDWWGEQPRPERIPAETGQHAKIVGECRGRNLYSTGSYCPLRWTPSPLSIVSSRAEYWAWREGLAVLADRLKLEKFTALHPKAPQSPWFDDQSEECDGIVLPVLANGHNDVSAYGTLPLKPQRERAGMPFHRIRTRDRNSVETVV